MKKLFYTLAFAQFLLMFSAGVATVFVVPALVTGCAGTRGQEQAYTTTEALGATVDAASEVFTDYEVVRAQQALGPAATKEDLRAWVRSEPSYQTFTGLRNQFNNVFNQWCQINATLATQTNAPSALADPKFRLAAIQAAGELTLFIAGIVGHDKVQVVRP